MKKIAFNLENLSFRGTVTALKDYAHYNQEILRNESIICFNKNILESSQNDENFSRSKEILEHFLSNYGWFQYSSIEELEDELENHGCDYIYFLKAGFNDGLFTKRTKSLIHCVFNYNQPHGYKYSYVSEWLAKQNSGTFVPHIVSLPEKIGKTVWNKDNLVLGRYGGFDQFDIDFVKNVIGYVVNNDKKITFRFVNTRKFIDHPQVEFYDAIIDPQDKTDFILGCDAMIHARSDGESFGLSICEFLFHNKPVLTFGGGRDKNNIELLKNYPDLVYYNEYQLLEQIFKLKYNKFYSSNNEFDDHDYEIKEKYGPEKVMVKFNEAFLC